MMMMMMTTTTTTTTMMMMMAAVVVVMVVLVLVLVLVVLVVVVMVTMTMTMTMLARKMAEASWFHVDDILSVPGASCAARPEVRTKMVLIQLNGTRTPVCSQV